MNRNTLHYLISFAITLQTAIFLFEFTNLSYSLVFGISFLLPNLVNIGWEVYHNLKGNYFDVFDILRGLIGSIFGILITTIIYPEV